MEYCKSCVMPNTRPGIKFTDDGICSACVNHKKKDNIDWDNRYEELEKLCNKFRGKNGDGYDCIIAVSGGKDSHYQVHIMKEQFNMNPLLVTVEDNMTMTNAGKRNIKNISETFDCNIISLKPNLKTQKKIMRKTFEKYGKPTWYIDRLIYTYPLHIASKFDIPLVVYGENVSYEYGGYDSKETYSAKEQINNGVATDIPEEVLMENNISKKDLVFIDPPSNNELEKLEPIYLSYFVRWNSYKNYLFAKKRGFIDLENEWNRSNHVENYDQIDSIGYLFHPWLKYPKFGHAFATDYASRMVRYGLIEREEAVELVKKHDHNLDQKIIDDFCEFLGYDLDQFWEIVDRFYNEDLFKKDIHGKWVLKEPLE
ncbi:MAG: N-acetyl sugar amidotransferase [Bacillota bacterium]